MATKRKKAVVATAGFVEEKISGLARSVREMNEEQLRRLKGLESRLDSLEEMGRKSPGCSPLRDDCDVAAPEARFYGRGVTETLCAATSSSGREIDRNQGEAAKLLEETQQSWYWGSKSLTCPKPRLSVEPENVARVNKALAGEYSCYESDAQDHPVLLVLSHVVRLQKRLDENERLIRFLVKKAAGIE